MAKTEKEPPNVVHQNAILVETIEKELRHSKLFTNYSVNPFKRLEGLTGKPNSETEEGDIDSNFIKIIQRSRMEPAKKYVHPQTESQEIGWITKPLIEQNWKDPRLHFRRQVTDATKFQEELFKIKEQATMNN